MELLSESVVAVTASSMRPDIQEAQFAAGKIKEKLTYNNTEELTTGMQKVQPLPFLDQEIEKYHEQIKSSASKVSEMSDDVPAKVLAMVEGVVQVAKTGETSLFKASQLLEYTIDAYSYARAAHSDSFDLERASDAALGKYDQNFRKLIEGRIKSETDSDAELLDTCFQCLGSALSNADKDCGRVQSRKGQEDQEFTAEVFKDMHEQTQEMIEMEKSELEMIKQQCASDSNTVDLELQLLNKRMDESFHDHRLHEEERRHALEENRGEQARLEERLRQLKLEEGRLVAEVQTGEQLQRDAETALEGATGSLREWQGQITTLGKRTETALEIMEKMAECTDTIMEDAKTYKEYWTDRLEQLELVALLTKRDTLMAQGVLYNMVASDSSRNQEFLKRELKELDRSMKEASKTGWTKKVKEIKEKIEGSELEYESYKARVDENQGRLDDVKSSLANTDKRILTIKPAMRLDSLDDRSKLRKSALDKAFETGSAKDAAFNSKYKYGK